MPSTNSDTPATTSSTATEYAVTCPLRFSDFDLLGHLNQAVYQTLFELARVRWMTQMLPRTFQDPASSFVVVRSETDYVREVDFSNHEVVATCRVERLGTSSVVFSQQVRLLDGTVAADGTIVAVAFDGTTRSKRPLSDEERAIALS